jgi:uncharacterized protein (UPF0276 family)
MYGHALKMIGNTATLLEWDDRIPSFDEVHNEALKAMIFFDRLECARQFALFLAKNYDR